MPFLNSWPRGLFLKNHHTTSNVSTKAVFSIYSGSMISSTGKRWGSGRILHPFAVQFPGPGYDSFLSPFLLAWYFPLPFLKTTGCGRFTPMRTELPDPGGTEHAGPLHRRDEIQTVDFFLQRISKAGSLLGMYVSFVAHFPYFDYGPEYRIAENDGKLISVHQ